jgi:glycosyltransferase domain-containing protein
VLRGMTARAAGATAPRLTIVVPLKGRPAFTLRFLWHADRAHMPFRFLLADGEARPPLMDMLENPRQLFPHLDIEYVRCPDDASWSQYYAKIYDALRRVRTPYVLVAENDDFLAPAGIERAMDFLDAHQDYVCCGGGIAGFSIHASRQAPLGKLVGPINRVTYSYTPDENPADVSSSNVLARVLSGFQCHWFFYSVYRPKALELVWKEIVELDPSNFHTLEHFSTLRTLTQGMAHLDQTVTSYFKQFDTSLGGHWTTSGKAPKASFAHHFLRSRFSSDFTAMIEVVARAVAAADDGDIEEIAEELRLAAEPWMERIFRNNYSTPNKVRAKLRGYAPWFTEWQKARYRPMVIFDKRAIRETLRKNGASDKYLAAFQSELAQIEEALNGNEFRKFIAHYPAVMAA